jgi:hypothetical protein
LTKGYQNKFTNKNIIMSWNSWKEFGEVLGAGGRWHLDWEDGLIVMAGME